MRKKLSRHKYHMGLDVRKFSCAKISTFAVSNWKECVSLVNGSTYQSCMIRALEKSGHSWPSHIELYILL